MGAILRRLGVATLAIALLAVTASPAQAVVYRSDPGYDVQWTRESGTASPTNAERARVDIIRAAFGMGSTHVKLKIRVRAWVPACSTGVPCVGNATSYTLDLASADLTRQAQVAFNTTPNYVSSHVRWSNHNAGTSGNSCTRGQVKMRTSQAEDYVLLSAPRSCFPKGWRFRKANAATIYDRANANGDFYGNDNTGFTAINWTPKS